MIDTQGLHAPFLISWFGVWLFAFLGGWASAFIKINEIDNRLQYPFIAKPLIGTVAGGCYGDDYQRTSRTTSGELGVLVICWLNLLNANHHRVFGIYFRPKATKRAVQIRPK